MTTSTLVSIAAALLLFGCSSTQATQPVDSQQTSQQQPNLGGACGGYDKIICTSGMECYTQETKQDTERGPEHANGVCRMKLAGKGEACGPFANIKCESDYICERPDELDLKGTCVESK